MGYITNTLPLWQYTGNVTHIMGVAIESDLSLIKRIKTPEITTSMLLGVLSRYHDPRKKIHNLVRKGILRPIKQGVYIADEDLGMRPYSKEILANLIYGPSYISLETALAFYGFIPEKVTVTTSVCLGRGKAFSTPVGEFEYCHVKNSVYSLGVGLRELYPGSFCQFANPEKALIDLIYLREIRGKFNDSRRYYDYLVDSYRLDKQEIKKRTSLIKVRELSTYYSLQTIQWFSKELIKDLSR